MKGRKGPRGEPGESDAAERLRSIADPDELRAGAQGALRESLTRTASELFTPEELPRYLQLQLAGPPEGIASWRDLTGERLTQLGVPYHTDGLRADDSGMLAPTMVPVIIDYAALVEGREVCSSAGYDPKTTVAAFDGGVHRVTMTAPDVTVTRIAFPHTLMDLPFIDVTFRLRNTSDQFHAVTLVLLIKPFDEDGIVNLERFSLTKDNLMVLNRQTVAFACERPTSIAASVYDPHSGHMVAADVTGEVVSQAGLMQVRFGFDHQLEPGGDAEVTFFFYVDRTARHTHEELTLLLAQEAGILEQEHRLVVAQPAHVGYQTGDARLNRFAANQLLHLGALQSEAPHCLQGAGGATGLMALVQAYDRAGEPHRCRCARRSPARASCAGQDLPLRWAGTSARRARCSCAGSCFLSLTSSWPRLRSRRCCPGRWQSASSALCVVPVRRCTFCWERPSRATRGCCPTRTRHASFCAMNSSSDCSSRRMPRWSEWDRRPRTFPTWRPSPSTRCSERTGWRMRR